MKLDRTLRGYVWSGLAYFVLLELMLAAAVLYWPSFSENTAALKALAPLPVMREMLDQLATEGVSAYVNGQHFFKGCNTLGVAAAVLLAMNAVAGEAHRGTLELVLARPLSRRHVLLEKWAAGALATTLPVFLSSATIPWLLERVDEHMEFSWLMLASVHQCSFLLVVYGVAFLASCLSSRPMWIAFTLLFVTTFEFSLYLVKGLTRFSIFALVDIDDYVRIVNRDALDLRIVAPLLALAGLLLWLGLVAFRRRTP